jgi:hypothetical protein
MGRERIEVHRKFSVGWQLKVGRPLSVIFEVQQPLKAIHLFLLLWIFVPTTFD